MNQKGASARMFLDSGNPKETREAIETLGVLDGQTTNPTLVGKHPKVQERIQKGKPFKREELLEFYKEIVKKISTLITKGSVSIEVYADSTTSAQEMVIQGKEMFSWIPNAHIKYPTTKEGLEAASLSVAQDMRINMTLCFSQEQAAAVHAATRGAKKGDVFVSPFIGRLDDKGQNGMDVVANIVRMYKEKGSHVEVLAASIRNVDHMVEAIKVKSDIVTAPLAILKEWAEKKELLKDEDYTYPTNNLAQIPYKELDLERDWHEFSITHELTQKGIERFAEDWNALTNIAKN